jgi:DMSO/TMAO reductase YedYZ molybdopterin-dependent catalytic subunit
MGAAAGVIAGAAALAAGHLVAALTPPLPGPVTSVANTVRDAAPGWFVQWGIDTFGTADKPLLIAGVVAVSMVIAARTGMAAITRPAVAVAAFCGFGLVGIWSMATEPGGRPLAAVVSGVVAVGVGLAVLFALLAAARPARRGERRSALLAAADGGEALDPRVRQGDRRRFLTASATAGFAVAATALAARRGAEPATEVARRAVTLPPPSGAAALDQRTASALAHPVAATDGISPLITPIDRFYRIDTALFVPQVDVDRWDLRITGLVEREVSFTYDELLARSTVVEPVTLTCVSNEVGGDLIGTAVWQGVPLAELLAEARPERGADQLVGRSVDGWTAGFPTSAVHDGRVALVALGMNGEPLPVRHGFPARLVVAGLYGYVSATKWLRQVELTTWDGFDGYWVPRGWSKEGPIRTQSRIDTPRTGARVPAGPGVVAGVAWAPTRGIERVEVQVDDGPWRHADLGVALADATWVQWRVGWEATPGRHRLRVRATDANGATQPEERRPVAPDGATGWHTAEVEVGP